MTSNEDDLGPIDVVVLGFPEGAPMTGDAVPVLIDLVDRGIIRVLDAMFITKDGDGTVARVEAQDVGDGVLGGFAALSGASSGLMGGEDVTATADALDPGDSAVVIVYENRWAAPFIAAVRRNGGTPLAFQRIPVQDLLDALDAAEAAA